MKGSATMEERRSVHANLTVPNCNTWHLVAKRNGVSLSALLEFLAEDMVVYPPEKFHPRWETIVEDCRDLDTKRRARA